jgi:hypothetical protein
MILKKKLAVNGGLPGFTIMPPAAKNPFVKGFLDLPKLFIGFTIKRFWKSRNLFSKRFLVVEDILGGGFRPPSNSHLNHEETRKIFFLFIFSREGTRGNEEGEKVKDRSYKQVGNDPCRTRTYNLLIKSQLLYHLS